MMLLLAGSFLWRAAGRRKLETTAVQSAADIGYRGICIPAGVGDGRSRGQQSPAGDSAIPAGQKRIVTRNIQAETEHFDDFWEMARKKTEDLGGYLESSGISGQRRKKTEVQI